MSHDQNVVPDCVEEELVQHHEHGTLRAEARAHQSPFYYG